MSTRRSFLQSAVFLPSLLSAHAFAQDSSNATLPFADFENGSWGDWTTEGLAFGDRPATDGLFPGKIRGFGGRGFVCSLHPRKGNAATGKAISREFVIEKPFITFKIGGGNFPGQACLNLVVDGKIERTATGDGTANLSDKSWDVSALVGETGHLEIVDDTVSDQRGYVLVDDIGFATLPTDKSILNIRDDPTLAKRDSWKTLQYFADNAQDWRIYRPEVVFGVSANRLMELDAKICERLIESDFDYAQNKFSVASLASNIKLAVTEISRSNNIENGSCLEQRMLASGVSAWVRTHILYNDALATDRVPHNTKALYWTSATVLRQPEIFAVCAGFSRLTKDIADALKLKNYLVLGVLRGTRRATPLKWTHSWNVFSFDAPDGKPFFTPCDNTTGRVALDVARRKQGQVHHPDCFPLYPDEWGYFLWRQRATAMDRDEPLIRECAFDRWTEQVWREINTPILESLIPTVQTWETGATINLMPL